MTEIYKDKMKTLQYVFLLSSLFAFQALLFVSTATEARCLLLQTMSLERNGGRHHAPPPPPHYSPGPVQKLKSPPTSAAYVLRHRHSPPPPPRYNPGPTPGLSTVPATSGNPTAQIHILYQNSPPNLYAASA